MDTVINSMSGLMTQNSQKINNSQDKFFSDFFNIEE